MWSPFLTGKHEKDVIERQNTKLKEDKMSILKDAVMEILESLQPSVSVAMCAMPEASLYAGECDCSGICSNSCSGRCSSGCSGNCGSGCYGLNS